MSDPDRIVAIGFLTERDLTVLGQGFRRAYPVGDHHDFDELLRRIDAAEAFASAASAELTSRPKLEQRR